MPDPFMWTYQHFTAETTAFSCSSSTKCFSIECNPSLYQCSDNTLQAKYMWHLKEDKLQENLQCAASN